MYNICTCDEDEDGEDGRIFSNLSSRTHLGNRLFSLFAIHIVLDAAVALEGLSSEIGEMTSKEQHVSWLNTNGEAHEKGRVQD